MPSTRVRLARAAAVVALFVCTLASFGDARADDPVETAHLARARDLYLLHCARCHGEGARGDGPDGQVLATRPPDLRASAILRRSPDDDLVRRILRSELRFASSPRLAQTRAETEALAAYLRSMPKLPWQAIDAGRATYLGRCAPCHGRYGHGDGFARNGLPLRDLAAERSLDRTELALRVRHAKPGMPALTPPIDDAEARNLGAFVDVLSPGYELYFRFCVSCHGRHGRAGEGEPGQEPWLVFDESYFSKLDPAELRHRIWHMLRGAKGPMPHFETTLSAAEVLDIVAYVRSLPSDSAR